LELTIQDWKDVANILVIAVRCVRDLRKGNSTQAAKKKPSAARRKK
jgi:hypothetical protein